LAGCQPVDQSHDQLAGCLIGAFFASLESERRPCRVSARPGGRYKAESFDRRNGLRKIWLCVLAGAMLLMTAGAAFGFVTAEYLGTDQFHQELKEI